MKKTVSLVLILLLVFLFSACNKEKPDEISSLSSESENSADESSETDDSEFLEQTDTITWTVEIPECFSEYREGVVRYSNIDPESNFARDAVEFAVKYLEKTFSENPEIKSFEITNAEVNVNKTTWQININMYSPGYRNEDLLNNFLVIRTVSNIELVDGAWNTFPDFDLNEPMELQLFVVYDPENIYADANGIEGYYWKQKDISLGPDLIPDYSDEELFAELYAREKMINWYPIHTYIEAESEDAAAAVDCMKAYLENGLENDPAVLSYEILNIEPDINHTNWYINTVQQTDFRCGELWASVLCLNVTFLMDVDDTAEKLGDFSAPWGDYDNIPVEYNFYLVRNYDKWEVFGGSTYPHDAFDDLTDIDLIRAINMLP